MPCTYYTAGEERELARQATDEAEARSKRDRKELNKVTKVACELMQQLQYQMESRGERITISPETQRWWREHQARDTRRKGSKQRVVRK